MTDRQGFSLPRSFYVEASNWLDRRAAGEPGLEPKLAAWLEADPRNRQAFAETVAVLGETQILPEGSGGFDGNLPRAPFYLRHSTHVGLTGIAAVALAGVASVWLTGHYVIPEVISPAQAATYETRIGEIRTYRLPDASALTLDTDTRVRVTWTGEDRHIDLSKGRVRLENTDPLKPVTVTAGKRSAILTSAVFDAGRTDSDLRISAPLQVIQLDAAQPESGAPRQIVAGSQLVIGTPAGVAPLQQADIQWVSGMLVLDGDRLDAAIDAINRYNLKKVRLGDAALASRKITGAFRANDPEAFAIAAGKLLDLRVDRSKAGEIAILPN
jgi:transmembrane sensor